MLSTKKSWPHQPSSISFLNESNFMLLCDADSLKLLFLKKKRTWLHVHMLFYKNTVPFSSVSLKLRCFQKWFENHSNPNQSREYATQRIRSIIWYVITIKNVWRSFDFCQLEFFLLSHCRHLCYIKCQNLIAWWQRTSACTLEQQTKVRKWKSQNQFETKNYWLWESSSWTLKRKQITFDSRILNGSLNKLTQKRRKMVRILLLFPLVTRLRFLCVSKSELSWNNRGKVYLSVFIKAT